MVIACHVPLWVHGTPIFQYVGFCVARSPIPGNAKASTSGTSKESGSHVFCFICHELTTNNHPSRDSIGKNLQKLKSMVRLRHLSVLLMLCVLGVFSANSGLIAKTFESNGISYVEEDIANQTVSVTKHRNAGSKYSGLVNIPASVEYDGKTYTVVGIDNEAFRGQVELTSVVFSKTLEFIGYKAFLGASNLKTVAFSSSGVLTEIGAQAFKSCRYLSNINLPNSLKTIGEYAFEDCEALKTIKWGNSLETIGKAAFKGCGNLESDLIIPNSVKSIGELCFMNCVNIKRAAIGSSVEIIGADAFLQCTALEDVSLPESLKEIGYEAFRGCWNLPSIEIPDSVTKMGYGAFRYCVSLSDVKLGESLKEIEGWTFEQTAIRKIDIPNSVTTIGAYSFIECVDLQEVNFGLGLEAIYDSAFLGCVSITNIDLPESLKTIGSLVFAKCENLQFVTIPSSVYDISDRAFAFCPNIMGVYNLARTPQNIYNREVFYQSGIDGHVVVHVYEDLYDLYTTTIGWYDIGTDYLCGIEIVADIENASVESIVFAEDPIYCKIGEQKKPNVAIYPLNASNKELQWISSDESVLYVDMYSGDIIGLEEGEAFLTATATDGSNVSASVKVIVTDEAGIGDVMIDRPTETVIYDLYGRRLNRLQRGINIVNGKKVYVK